jgi:hypothetical protein
MGMTGEFTVLMNPAHEHKLVFNPQIDPTPLASGEMEHYRCTICEKVYSDEKGEFRIRDEGSLVLEYKNEFIVDQDQLQDIVQQVNPGENVELPVPDGMTHLVLPSQALQEILNKESILEFILGNTVVQVDATALTTIHGQSGDAEVTVQVMQVAAQELKEPQKKALEERDVVYILSAEVRCGDVSIHDFGGGTVTVRMPFTPEPNMGYQVIYVADDGAVTIIPSKFENGHLCFSTGHFSEYAIVKDPAAPPAQTPEVSGKFPWVTVAAAAVILCGGTVLLIWKRRKK